MVVGTVSPSFTVKGVINSPKEYKVQVMTEEMLDAGYMSDSFQIVLKFPEVSIPGEPIVEHQVSGEAVNVLVTHRVVDCVLGTAESRHSRESLIDLLTTKQMAMNLDLVYNYTNKIMLVTEATTVSIRNCS